MEHILSLVQHYALPFVLVISVVVFAHEFGHYWVAKKCGIRIESFSIGFGPKLFGWTDKSGTVWQVACLPFGGYVKMFGDSDAASSPDQAALTVMTEAEKKVSFHYQPVNTRIAVVTAGPIANYLFAIVTLALLFSFQGQPFTPAVVNALQENSVAEKAGFLPKDRVVSIDDTAIERFEDIKRIVSMNSGTPISVVVERDGAMKTIVLTPEVSIQKDRLGSEHRLGKIGIISTGLDYKKWPPLTALWKSVIEAWKITGDTLKGLGQIISGVRGSEEIGGPLRIAEMSGHVAEDGFPAILWFAAVISINLGLINIFPIPLLDGGHFLFFVCEKILRRPLSEKTQEIGMRIGLTLVLSLMVFATWNDLVHLKVFEKIKDLLS